MAENTAEKTELTANRIVLVVSNLAHGGEGSVTISLARRLKKEGREVLVLFNGGSGQNALRSAGVETVLYPHFRIPWLFWRSWSGLAQIQAFKPDLIHVQGHDLGTFVKQLASRLQCPYVLTVNDHIGKLKNLRTDRKWLRLIIAVSEVLREELVNAIRVPKERIRLIPHGVNVTNLKRFLPGGHSSNGGQEGAAPIIKSEANGAIPVVGTIVPLVNDKGLQFFLRAARDVLEQKDSVHFLVAGQGLGNLKIRDLAKKLGLNGSITFVDYVDDHVQLIQAMDIFVLPVVKEGFGLSALEAMACGRPVVASGVGGLYSIVRDRETGLVVPSHDSGALSTAIIELLDHPELAGELTTKALEMVENEFNQEVLFQKIFNTYDEAIEEIENGSSSKF